MAREKKGAGKPAPTPSPHPGVYLQKRSGRFEAQFRARKVTRTFSSPEEAGAWLDQVAAAFEAAVRPLLETRTCPTCGQEFHPRSRTHTYCRLEHHPPAAESVTVRPRIVRTPGGSFEVNIG